VCHERVNTFFNFYLYDADDNGSVCRGIKIHGIHVMCYGWKSNTEKIRYEWSVKCGLFQTIMKQSFKYKNVHRLWWLVKDQLSIVDHEVFRHMRNQIDEEIK